MFDHLLKQDQVHAMSSAGEQGRDIQHRPLGTAAGEVGHDQGEVHASASRTLASTVSTGTSDIG